MGGSWTGQKLVWTLSKLGRKRRMKMKNERRTRNVLVAPVRLQDPLRRPFRLFQNRRDGRHRRSLIIGQRAQVHRCLLQTRPFLIQALSYPRNLHPLRLHLRPSYRVQVGPSKSGPHRLRNNLPTFHLPHSFHQILSRRPHPPSHSRKPPSLLAPVPNGDMR